MNSQAKTQRSISWRTRFSILCGIITIVFLGYTGYWHFVKSKLDQTFTSYIGKLRDEGYQIVFSDYKIGGFPYRFDFQINQLSYSHSINGSEGSLDHLRITAMSYNLTHIIAKLPQNLKILTPMGVTYRLTIDKGRLSLNWKDGQIDRVSVDLNEWIISSGDHVFTQSDKLILHISKAPENDRNLRLFVGAENTWMPENPSIPKYLGLKIDRVEIAAILKDFRPLPRDIKRFKALLRQADAMNIEKMLLKWGGVNFSGRGRFWVNDEASLSGRFGIRLDETDALIQDLQAGGIDNGVITAIRLIDTAGGDEGFAEFKMSENGIYHGFFRLADSPELHHFTQP